jgi:pyrimidine deaminase RibD-like protein
MISQRDTELLRQAVELADLSPQNAASFSVGALIASQDGHVLATGYTREFGENWHAEEVAIEKARQSGISLAGQGYRAARAAPSTSSTPASRASSTASANRPSSCIRAGASCWRKPA